MKLISHCSVEKLLHRLKVTMFNVSFTPNTKKQRSSEPKGTNSLVEMPPKKRVSEQKEVTHALVRLLEACRAGDVSLVQAAISQLLDLSGAAVLDKKPDRDETALHCACFLNHEKQHSNSSEAVKMLIAAGANVNIPNIHGRTPIHYADVECMKLLVAAGANVNHKDKEGFTALHDATRASTIVTIDIPRVQALLDVGGADPNVKNDAGEHTLFDADPACVSMLVAAGASLEQLNNDKQTPLLAASQKKVFLPQVKALLQAGANPNAKDRSGQTVLHVAAACMVDLLVAAGADFESLNAKGMTPLCRAACKLLNQDGLKMNAKKIKALCALGANPNSADPNQFSALAYTTYVLDEMASRATGVLLAAGAEPNQSLEEEDWSPLYFSGPGADVAPTVRIVLEAFVPFLL